MIFRVRPEKRFCISFFILELSDWNFLGFCIYMRKNYYFDNKHSCWIGLNFFKKLLFYRTIASHINGFRMQQFHSGLTFFLCILFCRFTWKHGKEGDNFYSSLPFLPTHKHSKFESMWKFWSGNTINKYKKEVYRSHVQTSSYVSRKRGNSTAHPEFETIQSDDAAIYRRRMFLHNFLRSS